MLIDASGFSTGMRPSLPLLVLALFALGATLPLGQASERAVLCAGALELGAAGAAVKTVPCTVLTPHKEVELTLTCTGFVPHALVTVLPGTQGGGPSLGTDNGCVRGALALPSVPGQYAVVLEGAGSGRIEFEVTGVGAPSSLTLSALVERDLGLGGSMVLDERLSAGPIRQIVIRCDSSVAELSLTDPLLGTGGLSIGPNVAHCAFAPVHVVSAPQHYRSLHVQGFVAGQGKLSVEFWT